MQSRLRACTQNSYAAAICSSESISSDGTRSGEIQVLRVPRDRIPMPPDDGAVPKLVFSIQPGDARFDPPAAIRFPNVDGLPPGRVLALTSFDHDLGAYVVVGTAQVDDDGAFVASEPGQGIVRGGWHFALPPDPTRRRQ